MGTIVVFQQELGTYLWTMHILNSSMRKKTQIYLHTASSLQKYNQTLVPCSKAEVMSMKQKNTWAFQDPDHSSPCSLCCVPQTHWQSFQSLIFLWNSLFTFSEPPFAAPTNVGSDGDLVLLLTFCQNVLLVLSAYSAAARLLALCISTSLLQVCQIGHFMANFWKCDHF